MSLIPTWPIAFGALVVGLAAGAALDHTIMSARIDKMKAATAEVDRQRAEIRAADELDARTKEQKLTARVGQVEQEKTNAINANNRRLAAELDRLRQRPDRRPAPGGEAAAARTAPTCSTTDLSWFNATEGTFVCSYLPGAAMGNAKSVFAVSDGTSNNYMYAGTRNGSSNYGTNSRVSAGAVETVGSFGAADTSAQKVAYAFKSGDYSASQRGSATAAGTNTVPTVTALYLASLSGTLTFNGWISSLQYYNLRLSDAQLQAKST